MLQYWEKFMWDKISQMFLLGSLSGIAVLGDVIREYLLVNLIVLFVYVNMGIILIRMYLRKKFEYSVPHLPLRILILPGLISHGTAESHDADTLMNINFIVNADASVRWDPFIFVIMISMYIQNGSRSKRCKKGKIPRIQIPTGNNQVNSLKLALFEIIPQIF